MTVAIDDLANDGNATDKPFPFSLPLGKDNVRRGLAGIDDLFAADGIADQEINCGGGAGESAAFDAGLDPAPLSCE